jgi:hypothetical protein
MVAESKNEEKATEIPDALRVVHDIFFEDKSFEQGVIEWCKMRVHLISLNSATNEQSLMYSTLFLDFSTFLETNLEIAMEKRGLQFSILVDAMRICAGKEVHTREYALFESLAASFDYTSFMLLMRETKRGNQWTMASMFSR